MNTSYLLILVVFDKLSLNVFSWDNTVSYVHSKLSDNYIYARRNGWERRQTGDTQLYVYITECRIDYKIPRISKLTEPHDMLFVY